MRKILPLTALLLSACGTLFTGTTQNVSFNSNVKGAKVYIDGMEICTAPCQTTIDRSSDSLQVVAKKKGYEDRVVILRSGINRTSFFNLTFAPSWLTDLVAGGVWEYKNNQVYLNMEPKGLSAAERQEFLRQSSARRFALVNYDELMIEAATSKVGEFTQALVELSGIKEADLQQGLMNSTGEISFVQAMLE